MIHKITMPDLESPVRVDSGTAVMCPRCTGAFRTPNDDPRAVIACPWCGSHHPRPALGALAPQAAPTSVRPPTRALALAAGLLLSAGVLAAVWVGFRRFQPGVNPIVGPTGPANPQVADALNQARTAAAQALAAPDWRAASPWLLEAGALESEMSNYHAAHPWRPRTLTGSHTGSLQQGPSHRIVQLSVPTAEGAPVTLSVHETPKGWKLDWKRLVNYRQFAWEQFHDARSADPMVLDVLALRGSATATHFTAVGQSPETAIAVRLEGSSLGRPAIAIVPKASDLGRLFQRELTWEQPRKYRCQVRHLAPGPIPPLVEITAYEGEGWGER